MRNFNYILRSFFFFRKQHLVLFIGTVVSTAILTGALIVGDSVKYSLKHLVDLRLGDARYAMVTGDRFVRSHLASELADTLKLPVVSVLQLNGIAINPDADLRINHAQVLGIDKNFWNLANIVKPELKNDEALVSAGVAAKLKIKVGDELVLRVQQVSMMPLSAPFARETDPSVAFRLTVKSILSDVELGRFSLKSNQAAPYNIFVSQIMLQQKLELPERVNLILVGSKTQIPIEESQLNAGLKKSWKLADAGLYIRELASTKQYEVLSNRVFIDDPLANSMIQKDSTAQSIITYLVNSLKCKDNETPYSFATAAAFSDPEIGMDTNQVVINQWLADDLGAKPGDSLTLNYYVLGPLRSLQTQAHTFQIKKIIPALSGEVNPDLMPEYPGLADAGSCREWDTGIPIDLKKIRDKDEKYWNQYRGTPKAILTLDSGLKLWSNKSGSYTAIRFPMNHKTKVQLQNELLSFIQPSDIGLQFTSVYQQGNRAATHGVDFGQLFLSLSFFVIAGALLLLILIYRLNAASREFENHTLSSLGFNYKTILKIRITENLPAIVSGSIAGAFMGIVYNLLVIKALNSVWNDIVRTHQIEMVLKPTTLVIGAFTGFFIILLSIVLVTRRLLKKPHTLQEKSLRSMTRIRWKKLMPGLISIITLSGTFTLVAYALITSIDTNSSLFLSAGALFLTGLLVILYQLLVRQGNKPLFISFGIIQLAIKNLALNKGRSIATISLLALGTFSIIITGANRKTFYEVEQNRKSGTGGFLYWGETSLPVPFNLNTNEGKQKLGIDKQDTIFNKMKFVQFYNHVGDDASCLNLNQVQKPGILAVNPRELDQRHCFSFANLLSGIDSQSPWLALNRSFNDSVIPAYADQTVITWGLMKKAGDTLNYTDERGKPLKVVLTGGLSSSIFQGSILISDQFFIRHFPSASGGSRYFLVDAPQNEKQEVAEVLTNYLKDYGLELTATSERLAEFNSVTNTYLNVFLLLGGLGVLIGTIGLGIVLLRNMMERKFELALLTAVGYQRKTLFKVIFTENVLLLIAGILIGVLSALVGILPSILSPAFSIPYGFVTSILILILLNGLTWIWISVRQVLKGNLSQSLRNE